MSTVAIVCEYNPFHNGHRFQIESQKKALKADAVIAIMSGNFVQRGAPAICDKWQRTKMALSGGADLVIELPVVFATQSAEHFARGAVALADALGVVDYLSFGSECDDIKLLKKAAHIVEDEKIKEKIAENLKSGMSYPLARAAACGEEFSKVLSEPNNILAIEYIKAIEEHKSRIIPVPLLRKGSAHHSDSACGKYASAGYLRRCIADNEPFDKFLPEESAQILKEADLFTDMTALDNVITYLLRTKTEEELAFLSDMTEGLEYRFKKAGAVCSSFDEIAEYVKTKRYTKTRIDRMLINILLSIKKEDVKAKPEYIRLLGFNKKGKELVLEMKKKSPLSVITKVADAKLSPAAEKMLSKDIYATDIYSMLCLNGEMKKSGLDYRKSPIISDLS